MHFNLGCAMKCVIFSIQIAVEVHHCKDMPKRNIKISTTALSIENQRRCISLFLFLGIESVFMQTSSPAKHSRERIANHFR